MTKRGEIRITILTNGKQYTWKLGKPGCSTVIHDGDSELAKLVYQESVKRTPAMPEENHSKGIAVDFSQEKPVT